MWLLCRIESFGTLNRTKYCISFGTQNRTEAINPKTCVRSRQFPNGLGLVLVLALESMKLINFNSGSGSAMEHRTDPTTTLNQLVIIQNETHYTYLINLKYSCHKDTMAVHYSAATWLLFLTKRKGAKHEPSNPLGKLEKAIQIFRRKDFIFLVNRKQHQNGATWVQLHPNQYINKVKSYKLSER